MQAQPLLPLVLSCRVIEGDLQTLLMQEGKLHTCKVLSL